MESEVKRFLTILKIAMRVLGITNRDVGRKLGVSHSYMSRLLSGGIELKAEHLVQIPRALGLEPSEFFHIVYPRPPAQESAAAQQLREILSELQPPPPTQKQAPATEDQLREFMETLKRMLGEQGGGAARG
jgi:transcriptional regulator with XRE-family HTH domain